MPPANWPRWGALDRFKMACDFNALSIQRLSPQVRGSRSATTGILACWLNCLVRQSLQNGDNAFDGTRGECSDPGRYDREALESRKEFKPEDNAMDMATAMGIELLTEEQYRELQKLGNFDTKTSSWVKTPSAIRRLGGAIFCDRRYDTVFLYHNGAESYYAARGFRGLLRV